jgi:hypothetical protein
MRTKRVEGVRAFEVVSLDPKPQLYISYDGLTRLSQRPLLRDILEELQRRGLDQLHSFLRALRSVRSAQVYVYFHDYVSYGQGGGAEATAEFFYGTYLLLYEEPKPETGGRESLLLVHPASGTQRIELEVAT